MHSKLFDIRMEETMIHYLKKQWRLSALTCLFAIIAYGAQALIQLALMKVFDAVVLLDLRSTIFWTAVDLTCWGGYFLFTALQEHCQTKTIRALNNTVRDGLYHSFLRKSHTDFHQSDTGEYLARLTNDIKQLEQLAWIPFFGCVGRIAQIVFSILGLAFLHWSLVVFSVITAVVLWLSPKLFQKKLELLGQSCGVQQTAAINHLKDLLTGFDVLQFFGRGNLFLQQGNRISDDIEKPSCQLSYEKSRMEALIGFINVALQLGSLVLIAVLTSMGLVTTGTLAGGVNLIGGVANGFNSLAGLRLSLSASKPYFGKLPTVDTDSKTVDTDSKSEEVAPMSPLKASITVDRVSFGYDEKKPILKDASFRFEKGKKYALTGPSGCGKSTLLKLLLGWLPDYTGTILFDDVDIHTVTPAQLQQQMSYIEQNVFLFNTTIRENITLGEDFSEEQLHAAIQGSALAADLAAMPDGLDTVVGENGSNLSGGQKQRVAIARALIHNRSILLVDEGTSALDQKNADLVEKSLLTNPDLTLILISHHLSAERRAQFDRVYELTPVTQ